MKMRKFLQNKLWRDKTLAMMEQHGSRMQIRILDDHEFDIQLRKKILEEGQEIIHAASSQALLEELADICEVLDTLCALHDIHPQDIVAMQDKKREAHGGFEERIFVEYALHPDESFGAKYCLADPEKYPEIKE